MFTRYKGIDIPSNYSGNRFRQPIETEMKTHTGEIVGASRTSLSPSFRDGVSFQDPNEVNDVQENIYLEATEQNSNFGQEAPYNSNPEEGNNSYTDKFSDSDDFKEGDYTENRAEAQEEIDESPNPVCDFSENNEKQKNNFFKELSSVFGKLFANSKGDDMLLLFIVLLLTNDNNENNSDAVILLLLVLLYR